MSASTEVPVVPYPHQAHLAVVNPDDASRFDHQAMLAVAKITAPLGTMSVKLVDGIL